MNEIYYLKDLISMIRLKLPCLNTVLYEIDLSMVYHLNSLDETHNHEII